MKSKTKSTALKAGAGILTAAALAAAGAYFLSTDEGKAWVKKARKQVGDKMKQAKQMGEADYKRFVDAAVQRWGVVEGADREEMLAAARAMKADWARLRGHAQKMKAVVDRSRAKRAAKAAKPARRKTTAKKATSR